MEKEEKEGVLRGIQSALGGKKNTVVKVGL